MSIDEDEFDPVVALGPHLGASTAKDFFNAHLRAIVDIFELPFANNLLKVLEHGDSSSAKLVSDLLCPKAKLRVRETDAEIIVDYESGYVAGKMSFPKSPFMNEAISLVATAIALRTKLERRGRYMAINGEYFHTDALDDLWHEFHRKAQTLWNMGIEQPNAIEKFAYHTLKIITIREPSHKPAPIGPKMQDTAPSYQEPYNPLFALGFRLGLPEGKFFLDQNFDRLAERYNVDLANNLRAVVTAGDISSARAVASALCPDAAFAEHETTDEFVIEYQSGPISGKMSAKRIIEPNMATALTAAAISLRYDIDHAGAPKQQSW